MSYSKRERYSRSVSRSLSRSRSPSPYVRGRSYSRSRSSSRSRSYDSSDAENLGNNLYVTGLSTRTTKRELEKHFASEGGKVLDSHLVVDPRTRESRGFGFVTMSNIEEADRCIKYLDRSVLGGRVITVEKARRRRGRTPTPGRYLGAKAVVGSRRRSRSYSPYNRSDYSSERQRSYSPYGRRGRERYRSRSYSRYSPSPYRGRYRSYSRSRSPYGKRYRSYSRDSRSPYGRRYDHRYRRDRSYSPPYYRRESAYYRRYPSYSPEGRSCSPSERRRVVSRSPPHHRRSQARDRSYSRSPIVSSRSRSASP